MDHLVDGGNFKFRSIDIIISISILVLVQSLQFVDEIWNGMPVVVSVVSGGEKKEE
jgi:hypothetical protein